MPSVVCPRKNGKKLILHATSLKTKSVLPPLPAPFFLKILNFTKFSKSIFFYLFSSSFFVLFPSFNWFFREMVELVFYKILIKFCKIIWEKNLIFIAPYFSKSQFLRAISIMRILFCTLWSNKRQTVFEKLKILE